MSNPSEYVLGIDLGANSLGTALIDIDKQDVVFTGVRIFKEGVESLDTAKEASRGVARREARQQRKQVDRRRRRMLGLWRILQSAGLLPLGERQAVLNQLDRQFQKLYPSPYALPYTLRARALDHKLEPFELGRALYHLGQRRGFLTNRKAALKEDEKLGLVKSGIVGLLADMQAAKARTLGEHFARNVDPLQKRIRARYTSRGMFIAEWEAIWTAQSVHYPDLLTPALRDRLHHQLFFQRPLRSQSHLVGKCELEPNEKRAPMALPVVQRFRLLTAVNNLRLISNRGPAPDFTSEMRQQTLSWLVTTETMKLSALRAKLKLPKGVIFSIETGGEENLKGDLVNARFKKHLGADWESLTPSQQTALVQNVITAPDDDEAVAALMATCKLNSESAIAALSITLPSGYFSISSRAIQALLPDLEAGITYAEARHRVYPPPPVSEPITKLKPVEIALPTIRNPIVMRALTELRKTVNAIVARFGKPSSIHIELGRDLRKGFDERMRIGKSNRDQEKRRDEAKEELSKQTGKPTSAINRRDIEKYLLWKECGHTCPYSGHSISINALFGDHPQFDIEHIIPLSRSLDDSFDNKTLCYREFNSIKSNRTPFEAFGAQEDEWQAMVSRVEGWNNDHKLSRFRMAEADPDAMLEAFTSRHLNDMRYASRLAAQYLGSLFGGSNGVDPTGQKRIITCSGPITAFLRNEWGLNRILNPQGTHKSRDDHRHHAVDAIAIALCSPATVKRLSDCAAQARAQGRRRFGMLPLPWPEFYAQVEKRIAETAVSLRPEYKLNAQMHDQTLYSPPKRSADNRSVVHIRQAVQNANVADIVDPTVRQAVELKIAELGSQKKLEGNWPELVHPNGRHVPILRVRVAKRETPVRLGKADSKRFVLPNSIHHTEIVRDESTKTTKFVNYPVSVIEAMRRKRDSEPIVRTDFGERASLVCTLRSGDILSLARTGDSLTELWLVRSVMSSGQMELNLLRDSRKKADIRKGAGLWSPSVNPVFKAGAQKVNVTHLGEIIRAND